MNEWVRKSIELANSRGYLDKLFKIYPIEVGISRDIAEEVRTRIQKAFKIKNKLDLIKELLRAPKFPVDDPYIASFRRHNFLLEKNPETIKRIGKKLLSFDLDAVLELAGKPKSPSRQLGQRFKKWLQTIGYSFLGEEEFKKYKKPAFLKGDDEKLKKFAIEELEVRGLHKGIDFVFKNKSKFILGEAKFLTDYGGTQNNQFREAIRVAKLKKDKILGIAVLDGIVWFNSNAYMHKTVKSLKGTALSALLLKKFIEKL